MIGFFKYPIRVVIFKRYGNALKPVFDLGRFEKRRIKTVDGVIENKYLVLKKEKVKIPPPEIKFYYDFGDKRYLYLLQIDRYTFYPISFDGNAMTVLIPIYEYQKDKKGNVILDESGNPKIKTDEKGNPIITYIQKPIFDGNIVLDDGRIVEVPTLIAHKTYDKEFWLSNEIEIAQKLYRSKSIWERYGNIIILGIIFMFMIMALYIGVSKYTELTRILVDGLKEVSNSLKEVGKLMAEAKATLKSV